MQLRGWLLAALILPLSMQQAHADDPLRHPSIQLFLQICVATHGQPAGVAYEAAKSSFTELPQTETWKYLADRPGKAWRGKVRGATYAIASEPSGLCTVAVHSGEATEVRAAVEAWLPPPESGVSVKKEQVPQTDPGLETTSYELRGGEVHERWILTISTASDSSLRALLTWSGL